jgi:hypothetical protein
MSQEVTQSPLREQAQQLMDGPLKHIRAAALAAALVPLASVFAAPASAQTGCSSGGTNCVFGTVFNDTNGDGIQDNGEVGIAGVEVQILCTGCNPLTDTITVFTDANGNYFSQTLDTSLTYSVSVLIPTGDQVSPVVPPQRERRQFERITVQYGERRVAPRHEHELRLRPVLRGESGDRHAGILEESS